MFRLLLLCFLLFSGVCFSEEAGLFHDFETGTDGWTAQKSSLSTSGKHYKSGSKSLEWTWKNKQASLELNFLALKIAGERNRPPHLGLWVYCTAPQNDRLYVDLYSNGQKLKTIWFNLRYTGWRVLGANYDTLGLPQGSSLDKIVIRAPGEKGLLYIDAVKPVFPSCPVRADDQQPWANNIALLDLPPTKTVYSSQDISLNRPYLPKYVTASKIPSKSKADIKRLVEHYSGSFPWGNGMGYSSFDNLKKDYDSLGIREIDGIVLGPPLECQDRGSVFLSLPDSLEFHGRFIPILRQVSNATRKEQGEQGAEALRMFLTLVRYMLDQGYQEGNNNYGWIGNGYDFRHFAGSVLTMKEPLEKAGILDPASKSVAHLCKGGSMLEKEPYSSCDEFYNYSANLPNAILLIPDEAQRYQRLRAYKRYIDTIITNDLPFGADGTIHHHGGHHLSYGAYAPPVLFRTQIIPFKGTEFFIGKEAHEKIRRHVRANSFQNVDGKLAPNLYLRAGTEINMDGISTALPAARMGSLDGKNPIDREMAAIYLYEMRGRKSPDVDEFSALGIKPQAPIGHITLNLAAIGIQRRESWQAAVAGMNQKYRGLEIYGWMENNNYSRYARNGSLFITINGENGWRKDGWNSNYWPGATNPVRLSEELFEGYTMFSNDNNMAGGTTLDKDGIWGNQFGCRDTRFRKSAFFFGNRIITITTDIEDMGIPENEFVTTLFQQTITPQSLPVEIQGEKTDSFSSTGEKATLLRDNLGNAYYVFPGVPVHFRRGSQEWTYFFKDNLKDPKDNPCVDMRKKQFREQPLSANTKYYTPTRGKFDLAYLSHGKHPDKKACTYIVLVSSSAEETSRFARNMESGNPPVRILQQDSSAHVTYDAETKSWGYVVFDPGVELPGPLKKISRPGFVIIRDSGSQYTISLGTGDPEQNHSFLLEFANGKKTELSPLYPLGNTVKIQK